jgi:hypothetical protein
LAGPLLARFVGSPMSDLPSSPSLPSRW